MGPSGLHDIGELLGLAGEGRGEMVESGDQVPGDGGGGGDVDGGGEDVVGRLGGVDVVVGVHVTAEPLGRERRDDLVGVHVGRGAGPGLEDVDGEVRVPVPAGHLVGCLLDRLRDVLVEHAQPRVHLRGRSLDPGEGLDVRPFDPLPGDGEVLHGPLGLGPPPGVHRDTDLAHGVVLDAKRLFLLLVGHCRSPPSWSASVTAGAIPAAGRWTDHSADLVLFRWLALKRAFFWRFPQVFMSHHLRVRLWLVSKNAA